MGNVSKELCSGFNFVCAAKTKCQMEASAERDPKITAEKLSRWENDLSMAGRGHQCKHM